MAAAHSPDQHQSENLSVTRSPVATKPPTYAAPASDDQQPEEWLAQRSDVHLYRTRSGMVPNDTHDVTLTTDELIDLSASWHMKAEDVMAEALFFGMGICGSDRWRQRYAYQRRNWIDTLLDDRCVSEAIARGEEMLRRSWNLSPHEWFVYRHGPQAERQALIERMQTEVNASIKGNSTLPTPTA